MPRPLKWGILVAGTIILSENIHKNAEKVTLIFAESHVSTEIGGPTWGNYQLIVPLFFITFDSINWGGPSSEDNFFAHGTLFHRHHNFCGSLVLNTILFLGISRYENQKKNPTYKMDASKAIYQDKLKEQVCYLFLTKHIFYQQKLWKPSRNL